MKLIDTHCHLGYESFDADRSEVIERAHMAGVTRMVVIGCSKNDAEKAIRLAEQYAPLFIAVSIHPTETGENFSSDFERITALANHEKVVAIGETGHRFPP